MALTQVRATHRPPELARRLGAVALSLTGFRWLAAGCEAATILLTWSLWRVREAPPMLPALTLPRVDTGPLLLATLLVVLVRPAAGVALHAAVLLYAMTVDQTRIQPEVVSLTLLMVGTLPWAWARAIGRAHLIALWCWAGLNKLLSPDFLGAAGSGRWMARGLMDHPPGVLLDHFGYAVALTELATGVLAIVPRTRRAAAVLALALHGGILYVLSPLRHDWNEAIWPWNVALAVAGFAFFWAWRERPLRALRGLPAPALALALAILVSPALWYVGRWDAYLSHHLYSDSAPVSLRCDASGAVHARAYPLAEEAPHRQRTNTAAGQGRGVPAECRKQNQSLDAFGAEMSKSQSNCPAERLAADENTFGALPQHV